MTSHQPPEDDPFEDDWGEAFQTDRTGRAATSDSHERIALPDPAVTPTTVHVVTRDSLYQRIFSRVLAPAGLDVRCYASAVEFLAEVGPNEAGCVIVDADPHAGGNSEGVAEGESDPDDAEEPDVSPAELLSRLAVSGSPIVMVAVTAGLAFEPALSLFRGGAAEVLEKPVKREQLLAVVREALAASASRRELRTAADRLSQLSERQFRLLGLIAAGRRDWSIALRMFVRPREVGRMREEVLGLLGLTSVGDAAEVYREAAERQAIVRRALARRTLRTRNA